MYFSNRSGHPMNHHEHKMPMKRMSGGGTPSDEEPLQSGKKLNVYLLTMTLCIRLNVIVNWVTWDINFDPYISVKN